MPVIALFFHKSLNDYLSVKALYFIFEVMTLMSLEHKQCVCFINNAEDNIIQREADLIFQSQETSCVFLSCASCARPRMPGAVPALPHPFQTTSPQS